MNDCFKEEYPHLRSDEEVYFTWWLDDMKEEGLIIEERYEPHAFKIFDKVDMTWAEQLKTKIRIRKYNAIREKTYTPDWIIKFDKSVMGVFTGGAPAPEKKKPFFTFCEFEDFTDLPIVTLDVKGSSAGRKRQSSANERDFPYKQRMMWDKFKIYVHTVRIEELFRSTFTPYRYFFTDQSGRKRKISKWQPITLQELLKERDICKDGESSDTQKSLFS